MNRHTIIAEYSERFDLEGMKVLRDLRYARIKYILKRAKLEIKFVIKLYSLHRASFRLNCTKSLAFGSIYALKSEANSNRLKLKLIRIQLNITNVSPYFKSPPEL